MDDALKPPYLLPDLVGPQGNAFFLIAQAGSILRKCGWEKAQIDEIQADMMSGDYDHLLDVIFETFTVVKQSDELEMIAREDLLGLDL